MKQPLSPPLAPFKRIATAAAIWVIVGVPVAAVIAGFRVFAWVIFSLPEMAATAAVLGAVQGLWLYLAGRPSEQEYGDLPWFGPASGGILGLLGFPPVFSRINGVVADRVDGGGFPLGRRLRWNRRRIRLGESWARARAQTFAGALSLAVYSCCLSPPLIITSTGPRPSDRLPVPPVSHQAVTNLSAGDARGSTWAGCYQYLGQLSRGSGVIGGDGGLLEMEQTDGSLNVLKVSGYALLGGVNGNGRFRFGAEITTGKDTLRVLWEGKFNSSSLDFTRRITVLRGTEYPEHHATNGNSSANLLQSLTATRVPARESFGPRAKANRSRETGILGSWLLRPIILLVLFLGASRPPLESPVAFEPICRLRIVC